MKRRELLAGIGIAGALSASPLTAVIAGQLDANPVLVKLCLKAATLGNKMGSDPDTQAQYEPAAIAIANALENQVTDEKQWNAIAKSVPGLNKITKDYATTGESGIAFIIIILIVWGLGFAAGWLARGWFRKKPED
jgi:hypothetical protein